jgi:SAM-dependent methyltransferase
MKGKTMQDLANQVLDSARGFVRDLEEIDRGLRRTATTVPPRQVKEQAASRFWALVRAIDSFRRESAKTDDGSLPRACREIISGWLFRSRYFNRSYCKPHGYAGDFRMVEWMYDLEGDRCEDPTQPGVVNCLDHLFATVHSVRSVWERRHYFSGLLLEEHRRRDGRLRVLDVACGGSRYTHDFLSRLEDASRVEVTLVDQDPAALAFCRTESLCPWAPQLTTLSVPIKRLSESLPHGDFDVVISAGLFDYLDAGPGRALLAHLVGLTAVGGVTAIANFHPADPSRSVKDWLVDWPLVYRDESSLASLFPDPTTVQTFVSENGSLGYAVARR